MESDTQNHSSWLDRPISTYLLHLNVEMLLVLLILVLAIASRFYHVDLRVMSHDEVNHVVPSYDLFRGLGYRHDPVTHGPMQFHLVALSYFLFGDNDLTSRLPSVLFSIATVVIVMVCFRRYLGRTGALIAGLLFLISPYMLFYGRYTRNEAFVALFGVSLLYGLLRYLDRGDKKALVIVTLATVFHFITKETAFIYTAQFLLLIAALFLDAVLRLRWWDNQKRNLFIFLIISMAFLAVATIGFAEWNSILIKATATPATDAINPATTLASAAMTPQRMAMLVCAALALLSVVGAGITLVKGLGMQRIRAQRTFDLLILVGTLILPQLAAFPVKFIGWDPLDYSSVGMIRTGIILGVFFVISAAIGIWWKPRFWLFNALLFYGIFVVFYTTFFTNGRGFFTGIIGSLGYWLAQQGVNRGSQPWYFYAFIQIPIYEYLGALGSLLALYFGMRYNLFSHIPGIAPAYQPVESLPESEIPADDNSEPPVESIEELPPQPQHGWFEPVAGELDDQKPHRVPVLAILIFWSVTSLIAFSFAGEKMPWLTVHIALGLLLTAGWGIGFLVDSIPWRQIANARGILALLLTSIFITSTAGLFTSLLGGQPPFQGNTLEQLSSTSNFLLSLVAMVGSGAGIFYLLKDWQWGNIIRMAAVVFFALTAILTIRTAAMASYKNYDTALEFLVYAHAASGPKEILAQIEDISLRTTKGKDLVVAYDNDGLYPYWWYLRDYPNKKWYTDKPTRDLLQAPLIIASETNYGKLDPIVKDNYTYFEYMRLWWPMQDYFNLTWDRVWGAVKNPQMRQALFDIWLNRDYTQYAQLTNNQSLTLENWQPSGRMRLYIRKDMLSEIWTYGAAPVAPQAPKADPYAQKTIQLSPDLSFGSSGSDPGLFNMPHGVAIAPDGTIFVADARNHRIQHFTADGQFINAWGSFADSSNGTAAPTSMFNEPWGVAVSPDGSVVYVTDTWNHRIQKFSAQGQFIKTWGYFGQAEKPDAFWGPRGIAVDSKGNVYVTDTGNKRVAVFTSEGEFITQFGEAGVDQGQFDEPVGIALDKAGNVYVNDTWNQRIQVFAPDASGTSFTPDRTWDVNAWFGQSLDNKPFITVDTSGNVFVTDPEGYRVLEFDPQGKILRVWGDVSDNITTFGLPSGIALDAEGRVWVSDASNNNLLRFTLPAQ